MELWHVERNWLNEEQIEYLNSLGHVSIRYASDHAQYDIKAAMMKTSVVATALFYSAFEEMLYLSADSVPLQNMDLLFNTQDYMSHGAVFWPGFS